VKFTGIKNIDDLLRFSEEIVDKITEENVMEQGMEDNSNYLGKEYRTIIPSLKEETEEENVKQGSPIKNLVIKRMKELGRLIENTENLEEKKKYKEELEELKHNFYNIIAA
jgi:hypothetical protein